MSYLLPHLRSGYAVDQAILSEEGRVVVLRFGHDWDATCMEMDEVRRLHRCFDAIGTLLVLPLVLHRRFWFSSFLIMVFCFTLPSFPAFGARYVTSAWTLSWLAFCS